AAEETGGREATNPGLAAVTSAATPPTEEFAGDFEGAFANETLPPLPPAPPPAEAAAPKPLPQDWKKLAKAEVNPRWFWMVTGAAAGVLLLVVAFFAIRARAAAKPAAEPDTALAQEVKERREALEETKKLFSAGRYEESLARARQVLSRSPNNEEARKYAQMAETAVKAHQAEA